ncbi:aconitase family protein [Schauerella aestuarii]|uniref:aconitase family protein n=1 Tax=Schauerella aestuarii TaxID=2511204 RepID=UPI00136C8A3D|nr:aconitase family protein [Achromobacter aestuarii]MYZ41899.1 3-isopropylmalate dehydratase [Achromobacter aestuarii]
MNDLHFDGRILFLSEDPALLVRQMHGEDLTLEEAGKLRDDVSTDEITPGWTCFYVDETLGKYPYVGLTCGGERPITPNGVKRGGFSVTVAGTRYGKGSSREASPFAEQAAGIRLVIAQNFERIYRQNCHNLGIYTSTDFGLIARIRANESIPLDDLIQGLDPVTADILRCGGLFNYTKARASGLVVLEKAPAANRPLTYIEKIIARSARVPAHAVGALPETVFVRADWRYSHDYVTGMCASFLKKHQGDDAQLVDVDSIKCFADHLVYLPVSMSPEKRELGLLDAAMAMGAMQEAFCKRYGVRLHGLSSSGTGSEGICHSIMSEQYVLPGQIAIGTDSHTPHCGAMGAFAFGIGATDMANAWLTGDVRVSAPKTCRVRLNGSLRHHVDAKDIVLHLLQLPEIKNGSLVGHVFEYQGDAIADLSTDARATLTNMVAEIGGLTGIVEPDNETVRFLSERRGVHFKLEDWMCSDEGAHYAATIDVDCSMLEAMVAQPGDPGNGIGVSTLVEDVAIDIAYGGSCTGGKYEDISAYYEVLKWGEEQGISLSNGVRFFLQFGSQDVRRRSEAAGMLDVFERMGVELVDPGCGACINAGPGASRSQEQVTISAINRNFPGRSGPGALWLGSPSTVAASALAGRIVGFEQLKAQSTTAGERCA